VPAAGSLVHRGPLIVGGWALGADGPALDALVLVDDQTAKRAELGRPSPQLAAGHPELRGADRSGWEVQVDVRGVQGSTAKLVLLARTSGGEWVELDRSEVQVEDPGVRAAKPGAVFTIARNEPKFLPLWLAYYGHHFAPSDIYVLDHDSTDGSTASLGDSCIRVAVHRDKIFDHMWLKGTVEDFQSFLLRSYSAVLFAEIDEFVVPDPSRYEGLGAPAARCTGYSVVHYPDEGEPPLRFEQAVLRQRKYWHRSPSYSKRLLSKVPLFWNVGFHAEFNAPAAPPDPDLYLIHLHRVDYDYCLARHRAAASGDWSEEDVQFNLGWHRRVVEPEEFRDWFFHGEDLGDRERELIPERIRQVL
jgi:Glycosyl transferase family 2